jgi:hypothetical protein
VNLNPLKLHNKKLNTSEYLFYSGLNVGVYKQIVETTNRRLASAANHRQSAGRDNRAAVQ